jgi:DNA-binding MarR family transcriptional regulator
LLRVERIAGYSSTGEGRFRRPDSSVSLSQLSALSTLAKEGAMTPGALALRERVRPPSMTRLIASLAELGFVARRAYGRQVLVSVSPSGTELIEAERKASQEWLKRTACALQCRAAQGFADSCRPDVGAR